MFRTVDTALVSMSQPIVPHHSGGMPSHSGETPRVTAGMSAWHADVVAVVLCTRGRRPAPPPPPRHPHRVDMLASRRRGAGVWDVSIGREHVDSGSGSVSGAQAAMPGKPDRSTPTPARTMRMTPVRGSTT